MRTRHLVFIASLAAMLGNPAWAQTAPARLAPASSSSAAPAPAGVAPRAGTVNLPTPSDFDDFATTTGVTTASQIVETTLSTNPVFGQVLFQGNFARESFKGFNPNYIISVGDTIALRMWGAVENQLELTVDAQGNVFVPKVGPVQVANVPNERLNETVENRIRSVFKADVGVYATLAAAVPVKVFVSGFVQRPGLYPGFASDSILTFLDRAGGINPKTGSYLDVRLLRGGQVVSQVDLYRFMTEGFLPAPQLKDGDSVFVGPSGPSVKISGLVTNTAQFEFKPGTVIRDLLSIAGISGRATHVRLARNVGPKRDAFYVPVNDPFLDTEAKTGDEIEVTADRLVKQIAVAVEGEHESAGFYVLPYEATLADLLKQIQYSAQSNSAGLQLFRKTVAERQKQVLDETLQKLEQSVLNARSWTPEEAELRSKEAALVLQFVERAKLIQPKGQVVLYAGVDPSTIALEDGDVLRIPRVSNVVQVHGEVYLPNSFIWRKRQDAGDYVEQAGGVLQRSSSDRILVISPSGEITQGSGTLVNPGDEVLVLPTVDSKKFQFSKDIIQVIYQIAIAAGVVARL
ncbi:protein involved in polysaccharide export, contains SLBB domain of the beta-grasp fold [Hydrocarboniphaga daqingensis]|uniref:Protein involved in polysaccharide export, contains SLBB domain of the beta-grasp fold n=1 Tax=Hydrocarboniphaga daqingensis TaxID=490188 RepID=A0A1M5N5T2_9GAMM|nr:polysaccharide biosynthesis/export family protein [Hydrocarboniphaga daqingensis]SHG84898.1 protein involved in polysaccharide export, contains SLBB domain of the beta-grasp fold [Hydrocarboniphaga daqingensis]